MKDRFGEQAGLYAQFRPSYPETLYDFVLDHCADRDRAWDCGTGNGQAALALAPHFSEVCATDLNERQLAHAPRHFNIYYLQCPAEQSPFPDRHFDLTVVAQALHWFDFGRFFPEVHRTARAGALLAVWGYDLLRIRPEIDAAIDRYYRNVIGPFWDAERRHVETHYRSISIPFPEIPVDRAFSMRYEWSLSQLEGYLQTWSAYRNYLREMEKDPLPALLAEIRAAWPDGKELCPVCFPIFLRLFRPR